jgi:hypothetical protein
VKIDPTTGKEVGGLILADGEIGYIMSEPEFDENGKLLPSKSSAYKIGDGVNRWKDLNEFGFSGNWADDVDEHEAGDDQMAVSKYLLVEKFEGIINSLAGHDEYITNHDTFIKTLQTFANEYKPIIDQLSVDSGDHAEAIEALDKTVNGWDEVETETDGDGGETEIITHHDGLVDKVSNLEKAIASSHEFVTEDEFKIMETNKVLKEGVIYFTYAVEESEE